MEKKRYSWGEAAHEAVYNCLVAARQAKWRDATMQDELPVEAVRRLARKAGTGRHP